MRHYVSLGFKQQNKLTVKIGLSAFISLGSKLSLTSLCAFFKSTFTGLCNEMIQLFQSTIFSKVPCPKAV